MVLAPAHFPTATKAERADPVPADPAVEKRARKLLDEAQGWADQLAAVWSRLLRREKRVIVEKLRGSKAREGTRFWDPPPPPHETKAFKVGRWIDKGRWLDELEEEIRPVFERLYSSYLKRGADLFTDEEKQRGGREEVRREREVLEELTRERISQAREYHEAWLNRLVEVVDEVATRDQSVMQDVLDEIEVQYTQAEGEVEAVAQSQAVASVNQVQLEIVRRSGMQGRKVWFTAIDERVRPAHRKVHGQRVDLDEPFKVPHRASVHDNWADVEMQYPGDRSAPPGLWVNCRCVLLFYPMTETGEPESGLEAAGRWVGMRRALEWDILGWVERKGVRRVRTPEGARQYGQPIGSVIVPDVVPDLPSRRTVPGARPTPTFDPKLKRAKRGFVLTLNAWDGQEKVTTDISRAELQRHLDALGKAMAADKGASPPTIHIFDNTEDYVGAFMMARRERDRRRGETGVRPDDSEVTGYPDATVVDKEAFIAPWVVRNLATLEKDRGPDGEWVDQIAYPQEWRKVAHEIAHTYSDGDVRWNTGLQPIVEEGGAEILSIDYVARAFGPGLTDTRWGERLTGEEDEDGRDISVRGVEAIIRGHVYSDRVAEVIAQGVRRNGWDREAVLADIERVFRGSTEDRNDFFELGQGRKTIRFRSSDGKYEPEDPTWAPLMESAPDDLRQITFRPSDDEHWDRVRQRAATLLWWLIGERGGAETKAVRKVRTPEGAEKYGQSIGTVIKPDVTPQVPKPRRPRAFAGNIMRDDREPHPDDATLEWRRCRKCDGSGYLSEYAGIAAGVCFACAGQGGGWVNPEEEKRKEEARKAREAAERVKAGEQAGLMETYRQGMLDQLEERHPQHGRWLRYHVDNRPEFDPSLGTFSGGEWVDTPTGRTSTNEPFTVADDIYVRTLGRDAGDAARREMGEKVPRRKKPAVEKDPVNDARDQIEGYLANYYGEQQVRGKRMQARFRGRCASCGDVIGKGDDMVYRDGQAFHPEHAAEEQGWRPLGLDDIPEEKAAVRKVRTPAGVRKYGQPIGSVITPDTPAVPTTPTPRIPRAKGRGRLVGDASKVVAHQSDPDRGQRLLELYASGLPERTSPRLGKLGSIEVLGSDTNRAAAKREVTDKILARLDPQTRQELAKGMAEERYKLVRSMASKTHISASEAGVKELDEGGSGELAEAFHRGGGLVTMRRLIPEDPFSHNIIWRQYQWDSGPGEWEASPYQNFVHLFPGLDPTLERNEWMRVAAKYPKGPESGSRHRVEGYDMNVLRGDDPRLIDALAADALSQFIRKWADTSNDNDTMALAIQEAIEEEFELEGARGWEVAVQADERWWEDFNRRMAEERARIPLYRKLVRAQYEETQQWFREHGITELLIYRGMKWKPWRGEDETPAWFDEALLKPPEFVTMEVEGEEMTEEVWPTIPTPQLRPASSWAWGSTTARNFAGINPYETQTRNLNAAVLATVIPVQSVLGTPRTGFGALPEEEVVVLAFGGEVQVLAKGEARKEQLLAEAGEVVMT